MAPGPLQGPLREPWLSCSGCRCPPVTMLSGAREYGNAYYSVLHDNSSFNILHYILYSIYIYLYVTEGCVLDISLLLWDFTIRRLLRLWSSCLHVGVFSGHHISSGQTDYRHVIKTTPYCSEMLVWKPDLWLGVDTEWSVKSKASFAVTSKNEHLLHLGSILTSADPLNLIGVVDTPTAGMWQYQTFIWP